MSLSATRIVGKEALMVFSWTVIECPLCVCRVEDLLYYDGGELVGQSMYDYHHALDTDSLDKAFKTCKYF